MLKWSLGLLTKRQSTWRSIVDLVRQRERLQRLAKSAIAYGREAKAQAASKPAPPPPPLMKPQPTSRTAMLEPFVREPSRLAHMTRSFVGLLAKDPATLPRVTAQDIGGAFGAKTLVSPEDVAVVAAAITMGRSIKWIEDRNEHLVVGAQARDERMDVDAAFAADGTLLGLRARLTMDQGAYPGFPIGAAMFTRIIKTMMPGPYRFPAFRFDATVIASNKATYVAYRGPWAVETWVRERLFDVAARELGIGRDEIRLPEHGHARGTPHQDDHRTDARRAHVGTRHLGAGARPRRFRQLAAASGCGTGGGEDPRARVLDLHRGGAGPARLRRVRNGRQPARC